MVLGLKPSALTALFKVEGKTETHRQAQTYWTPQRIHAQYRIIPLETHLPAQLEQPTPCCTISPPLLLVFYTALFSFLLLVHTQTCLHKPVARGHYPKGNLDSKTHTYASSSELLWRYSLVPCSSRSMGKGGLGAKGLQRSFWQQRRGYFLTFILEGTMLTQKSRRKQWYSNSGHEHGDVMALLY